MTRDLFLPFDLARIRADAALAVAAFGNVDGSILWLRHISATTAGATSTPAFDTGRQQVVATSDGSFGRGWQAADSKGKLHFGYFAAVPLKAGIHHDATTEVVTEMGILIYTGAMLIYQSPAPSLPPLVDKYDILIDAQGTRYVVGDTLRVAQAFGAAVLRYAALEARNRQDLIYTVPLT